MINWHSIILIAVTAFVTFMLRAVPFIIFGGDKKMPAPVKAVAELLPPAIMGVLIIYCIKGDIVSLCLNAPNGFICSEVALFAVIVVHLWKRNTLISIASGTVIYMILIRVLPPII